MIYFTVNTNACGFDKIPATQRSQVIESITGTALVDNLNANPGALWLIGNEPDSIYNCSPIMPELYAEIYHEFYTYIKTYDPSARVAIGGIVQPSPLRLEYLDKVLNHYHALYGEKLPTVLWNIHNYAFREVARGYGAGVPPGASSNIGWTYDLLQWMDVNLWVQNLHDMRQWMANRGERDKPLIITEFGQVVPDGFCWSGFCYTPEVSRDTLQASFSRFLTETDAIVGYPADGNRVVQFWAWFPLYDSYYGGDLVNPDGSLTPAGTTFAQIATQQFVPYADLYFVPTMTPSVVCRNQGPSLSWAVEMHNHGNAKIDSVPVRFTARDYASGQLLSSDDVTVGQVLTRYVSPQPHMSTEWPIASAGTYSLTFELDPARAISPAHRTGQPLTHQADVTISDLAITSLTADPSVVIVSAHPATPTLTINLRNLSLLTSSTGIMQLRVLAGKTDHLSRDLQVQALAPNTSLVITSTVTISEPGRYHVTAVLTQYAGSDQCAEDNIARLSLLGATSQLYLPLVFRSGP